MDFKPIHPQKIYERIVEQIKIMATEGNLRPGDRLPVEKEMADSLHVSRASVREALSALHLMGLVEIKLGEGTFFKQSNVNSIIQPLSLVLLMERHSVFEILTVRKGLEVEAAGLAAKNATKDDLTALEIIMEDMEKDLQSTNIGEIPDWKFHFNIAQSSKNILLVRLMNTISDTIQQTQKSSRQKLFMKPGNQQRLFKQHESIYNAIKMKDCESARQKMYEHLIFVEEEMS